jgi:hypothetical protein
MTSDYLTHEAVMVDMAKAIRGAETPDDAAARLLNAGYAIEEIEANLEDLLDREFQRGLALGITEQAM